MTLPRPVVALARDELLRSARLPSAALRLLLVLIAHACPATGRVWLPDRRLGELLDLPPAAIASALDALAERGLLEVHPPRPVRAVELGRLFKRDGGAPGNLPVDSRPA